MSLKRHCDACGGEIPDGERFLVLTADFDVRNGSGGSGYRGPVGVNSPYGEFHKTCAQTHGQAIIDRLMAGEEWKTP